MTSCVPESIATTPPALTVVRHAAFDEVTTADPAALAETLWKVLAGVAGMPAGPPGAPLPLPPVGGSTPGYKVPPALGDRLLAAVGPQGATVRDERCRPPVCLDARRLKRSRPNCAAAVAGIATVRPHAASTLRGIISIQNAAAHLASVAAAIAEACGPVGGVVLARDFGLGEAIAAALTHVEVPHVLVETPGPGGSETVPRLDPGAWVVVPPGHPAWAAGLLADPPVIVSAVPLPACRPRVLPRLFGRPDQLVFALVSHDQKFSPAEVHRLHAAFGLIAATCEVAGAARS
jgi:hypothetical protein